ncbi:transmembrane protein 53-like isoform X1 [Zingiber officinale]|uniref:transmembrane protein 53-like isoform X1 n=1 Tax=Zingiber officinale TaxID=94328 RepID=UPI001C4C99DD|nr:transmembrane protein 53-like isoform X1 [Zingiber officinale]
MEASTRLLGSTAAFHLQLRTIALPALSIPLSNPNHPRFPLVSSSPIPSIAFPRCSRPAFQCAVDGPFGSRPPFSSLSFSRLFGSIYSKDRAVVSGPGYKEGSFRWENDQKITEGGDPGFANEKGAIWTVVLLGWLGAELKHLNKYAMLYSSLGIRPVRFVVPVKELLGFDLGRRVEEKIACFTQELVSWCSETEKDGRERCLLFHSFSNTGWLTYGSILENLQNRPDIVQKIKGCIVDSGAAPEISPQIWAAGFSAALLKKRSSLVYSSTNGEVTNMDVTISGLEHKDNNFSFKETFLLSLLEKFFIVVLVLPDVNLRLKKIISILTNKQPSCPQLYLYSSADKVIPSKSVENFIQAQKSLGRIVHAFDFCLSPHVDHLRNYPQVYSTKINEFLRECYSAVV